MKATRIYIMLVFLLMIGGVTFNSCSSQQFTTTTNDKNKTQWLYIKCFQGLNNDSEYSDCLARNDIWDVFYIVSFTCPGKEKGDIYYDGKSLSGNYVFVGTYSYVTKDNISKTVQAYMPKDNFYELYNYDKEYLKRLLDIVLSYNAIQ